jgi:hypothetical protein
VCKSTATEHSKSEKFDFQGYKVPSEYTVKMTALLLASFVVTCLVGNVVDVCVLGLDNTQNV